MVQLECPWCDEELSVPLSSEQEAQVCPYCLTSWSYVTAEPELAEAA